jgi:prevent-host-death family protein
MKTVNIQEAKTHLSRLVEEAAAGNVVVIAKAGRPMVRLVPVTTLAGPRPLGLLADQVRESADCWDPDPEVDELFYGSAAEPEGPSPDSDLPSPSHSGDAPQRGRAGVTLLLDSHALLWALHAPERLRAEARDFIQDPERAVYFSAASVWELEIKAARGKLELPDDWLAAVEATGFLELPVTAAEARTSARLPWHHPDPFDRVLVAQAVLRGLRIATRDPLLASYDVPILPV